MHQVLYRKWRPQRFADVCGQDKITSVLKYEVESGKTAHAYLFCGSRGTGKTTCAKILAKAVNCPNAKDGEPCGECEICRGIDNGSIIDVVEMDAASNNGVDDIRVIRDEVAYLPTQCKYKVYIIDEVHMLSISAFNALLKTLEEPPEHVIFILATTELQKLPATIISRCVRFDFRRISMDVIADRLKYISSQEEISITDDGALLIARLAQGGMRDAVSMLELCSGEGATVDEARVRAVSGVASRDLCANLAVACIKGNTAKIYAIVGELYAQSKDISAFWTELVSFYRDMLVVKTVPAEKAVKYLEMTQEEYNLTLKCSAYFDIETLAYHTNVLDEAYASMQRNVVSKRLCAEFALVRLTHKLDNSNQALASRISALERGTVGMHSTVVSENNDFSEGASDLNNCNETVENEDNIAVNDKKSDGDNFAAVEQPRKNSASNGVLKALPYWKEITKEYNDQFGGLGSFINKTKAYRADGDKKVTILTENKMAVTYLRGKNESEFLISRLNQYSPTNTIEVKLTTEKGDENQYIDEIEDEITEM